MGNRPVTNPHKHQDQIEDEDHTVLVSVVSFWELVIKIQLKKFDLSTPIQDVADRLVANGFELLPVTLDHVKVIGSLPMTHKDPFDRLLIAHAIAESATLISADGIFARYPVPVIW